MQANERVGHTGAELTKGTDASNTHHLQMSLFRDISNRLREVRGAIRRTVAENDALQLQSNADDVDSYDFPTEDGRERAFLADLRDWLRGELLGDQTGSTTIQNGNHWLAEYVREAYQVGASAAEGRLLQAGVSLTPSDPKDLLRRPIAQQQLAELYARSFENLQDITDQAAQTLREALTGAVAAGKNPRTVARELNDELQSVERSRLLTLARTEIIRSHAQGALSVYEDVNATVVSHASRLTAKDASVCAFCRALDDVPFTLSEFQNVTVQWGSQTRRIGVPAHPNCRCSPMPEIGLDNTSLDSLADRIPNTAGGRPITILST